MNTKSLSATLGMLVLLVASCAPAAQATPTPTLRSPTATSPLAASPTPVSQKPTPTLVSVTAMPSTPVAASPKAGGTLVTVLARDPSSFDYPRLTPTDLSTPLYPFHDRLFTKNVTGPKCAVSPVEPAVATGWKWVDDRTFDLQLRQGVKFHNRPPMNGREMVAEDVAYSANKIWPTIIGAGVPELIVFLDKVEARDKYTARFHLKRPMAQWPAWMFGVQYTIVVGQEAFVPGKEITSPEQHVGLGPFIFESYTRGVSFKVRKNPDYWMKGQPYLDGVTYYVVPDQSTQISAMRSGRFDFLFERYPAALVDSVEKTAPNIQVYECPMLAPIGLSFRTDVKPFDDVRVRRAISMAVDRETLLKNVFGGRAILYYASVVPGLSGFMAKQDFPPEVRKYLEYNPAEAKKLLAEAGYPSGFEMTITATQRFLNMVAAAETLSAFLGEIGIKAKLDIRDYALMTRNMESVNYPNTASYWLGSGENEYIVLSRQFLSTATQGNYSKVKDDTYDRLFEEWLSTKDERRALELMRQLQVRQAEMAWYMPWPQANETGLAQPYVKNVLFRPTPKNWGDYAKFMWLDK